MCLWARSITFTFGCYETFCPLGLIWRGDSTFSFGTLVNVGVEFDQFAKLLCLVF